MRELVLARKLRQLFWKPTVEEEVREEIAHHLEALRVGLIAQGLSPEAALTEALQRLGNPDHLAPQMLREGRSRNRWFQATEWLGDLNQDIRLAWRSLRNAPATSLVVALSLGLGIAGATAAFSAVHSILLRALPYGAPGELVTLDEVGSDGPEDLWGLSHPSLLDVAARSQTLEGVAGYSLQGLTMPDGEETVSLSTARVTGAAFGLLRVAPLLGRVLGPADALPGAPAAAVLSHRLWIDRFAADSAVIGRTLQPDGTAAFTIVGVMPSGFWFPNEEVGLWLSMADPEPWMMNRSVHILQGIGRLADNASEESVGRELSAIARTLETEYPGADPGHGLVATRFQDRVVGEMRLTVLVLFGAVVMVTLLVTVNVGSILLARGAARRGEFAVRAALGAGRWRIVRQCLTESLCLATIGGALGIAGAWVCLQLLQSQLPPGVPRADGIGLDLPVLLFAAGVTMAAGLLFGLAPAWQGSTAAPRGVLQAATSRGGAGTGLRRLQGGFIVAQLALAQLLLLGAALFIQSLLRVQAVDPGFAPGQMLTMAVVLPPSRYDAAAVLGYYERLPDRLTLLPGVVAASAVSALPISGGDGHGELTIEGQPFAPGESPFSSFRRALPNYFATMGIPLVAGREFTPQDRGGTDPVIIINESFARRFWPDGSAIGRRLKIGSDEAAPWLTVVGVVGDVRNIGLDAEAGLAGYEPLAQRPRGSMQIVVRGQDNPLPLTDLVRRAIRAEDALLPVTGIATMDDRIAGSLAFRRFNARVLIGLGGLALLVAGVGVFGLTSQVVATRRSEFGIRLALGATPRGLIRLVVRRALGWASAGALMGLAGAWLASRVAARLLFATSFQEPRLLLGASGLLILLAVAAALVPAATGSRTDPALSLRTGS